MTHANITGALIAAPANDAFRAAFNRLTRAAAPYVDAESFYWGDLMLDAAQAADLSEGESMSILLRSMGSHIERGTNSERAEIRRGGFGWRAVLTITRRRFDTFTVDASPLSL